MAKYTEIIYVAEYGNDDTGNGSIRLPYATIAAAISAATTDSPLIKIEEGTFEINYLYNLSVANKHMTYEGEGIDTTIVVNKCAQPGSFRGTVDIYKTIIKPSDSFSGDTRAISYTTDKFEVNFYNCLFKKSDNGRYPTTSVFYASNSSAVYTNKNFYNCTILDMGGCQYGKIYLFNSVFINGTANTSNNQLTDCLNNDSSVTIDDEYKLSGNNNSTYGVYSGEFTWTKKMCFILQNGKYYTILDEYYNGSSYDEVDLSSILSDYESLCFNVKKLTEEITINDETFRPIDKFTGTIQLISNKACDINLSGIKTNKELVLASSQFTTKLAENIDFFNLNYQTKGNGEVKCAVSDDYGVTWKTWDSENLAWVSLSSVPPIKSYDSLTDEELVNWNTFLEEVSDKGFVPVQSDTTIDYNSLGDNLMFAYAIIRPAYADEASMTTLEYQFDAKGNFEKVDSDIVNISQSEEVITVTPKEDISLLRVNIGTSGTVNIINDSSSDGGSEGADGKSAYEIWLELGNTGTEEDFINSLKGADGTDGADGEKGENGVDGKSAYEVWLELGNTGTEEDFINSLKGEDGAAPEISLSRTEEDDGAIITVTDANGVTNNITIYDGSSSEGSGILVYDNYANVPTTIDEDGIVYIKNDYTDDANNYYTKGFYFADANNSKYIQITSETDWLNITGKPFEGLDFEYFSIDENLNLTFSATVFDDINTQLDAIGTELNKKATIDDTNDSTDNTWSASQIKAELDKKAENNTNHNHSNLNDVLNKLVVDESNNLQFDTKTIMTMDKYDSDSDGKVDYAKATETIEGLLATIEELNYLLGAKSNIQSQIDAISSGVNFKGEYTDFATMQSNITDPVKGDWVYILTDETQNDQANTQYVYDGTMWIYGGGRNTVNEASDTVKGVIQLSGDLTGTASSPQLAKVTEAQTIGYIKSITVDEKGRVINITEDDTLAQRIADLESRPQIYVSPTQPENLKDGDIWIEG